MSQEKSIIAIDQGTTHPRVQYCLVATVQYFFNKPKNSDRFILRRDGWSMTLEEIWDSTLNVLKPAVEEAKSLGREPIGIGITNQRETAVIWDRKTGECIYNAIVWQDRRTTQVCEALKANRHEEKVKSKTGLLLDPYFTASKFA